jgi:hypothetical protein
LAANAKNQTALACPHNQHEDAFGMMAKRPVTKIHGDRLGLVDYGTVIGSAPVNGSAPAKSDLTPIDR